MSEIITEENSKININSKTYYTKSKAAEALGVPYNTIIYAIAQKWLIPYQENPVLLIEESELFRFYNDRYRSNTSED